MNGFTMSYLTNIETLKENNNVFEPLKQTAIEINKKLNFPT